VSWTSVKDVLRWKRELDAKCYELHCVSKKLVLQVILQVFLRIAYLLIIRLMILILDETVIAASIRRQGLSSKHINLRPAELFRQLRHSSDTSQSAHDLRIAERRRLSLIVRERESTVETRSLSSSDRLLMTPVTDASFLST
jgi:hypothetical protein